MSKIEKAKFAVWLIVLLVCVASIVRGRLLNIPSYDGAWTRLSTEQRTSSAGSIPEVYSATFDGRKCLVMVGPLFDDLECE